jgi:hypothetical protein
MIRYSLILLESGLKGIRSRNYQALSSCCVSIVILAVQVWASSPYFYHIDQRVWVNTFAVMRRGYTISFTVPEVSLEASLEAHFFASHLYLAGTALQACISFPITNNVGALKLSNRRSLTFLLSTTPSTGEWMCVVNSWVRLPGGAL